MKKSWWQVSVDVPADMAETLAWLVADQTRAAVEVQDTETMIKSDSADLSRVLIAFGEAPDPSIPAVITGCLTVLGLGDRTIHTRAHEEEDWTEGWRAFFLPMRLSERVWVTPPWDRPAEPAEAVIVIDPGMAFGTGHHPTTRGVVQVLDTLLRDRPETTVLDVGCGSGILALAAARLGHRAVGVEIDAVALKNAEKNVALNGLADRVQLIEGSADAVDGRFDIVLANILAPTLIELAADLDARTGEHLIMAGLLAHQADGVLAAYPGFELADTVREDDWVVLHVRRRP